MIEQIYLDMDGVLCDFEKAAVEKNILDLKTRQVDWDTLRSEGATFWEELEWKSEGQKLYKFLELFCKEHKIDLCILSSVPGNAGKEGKRAWVKNNTNIPSINVCVVNKAFMKQRYASETSLLIDDYSKNIREFIQGGGNAIKFRNDSEEVIDKIKELVSGAEHE